MTELLTAYLEPLIAFVAGGGLVSLFTLKYTKKQAEASAMSAVQTVYQSTIKDLQSDKELMKQDNRELRGQISDLQKEVQIISKDLEMLKGFKCVVIDCKLRKKD